MVGLLAMMNGSRLSTSSSRRWTVSIAGKGVVLLAATNRPDALDPALLRPGRFDRRIPVELPDLSGRIAILEVHLAKVKTTGPIDLAAIARATAGASGADLANIVNEAALRSSTYG